MTQPKPSLSSLRRANRDLAQAQARLQRAKLRGRLLRQRQSLRGLRSRVGRLFYETAIRVLEEEKPYG